jgi:Fe-S oxidoreductase
VTTRIKDISKPADQQLLKLDPKKFMKLPPPLENEDNTLQELTEDQFGRYEASLDGFSVLQMPRPETREEKEALIQKFLDGLRKLVTPEDNWTFLQPLVLSLEHCAKCQTCNEACPVYVASGREDVYRPTYRSEVLRRIYLKYIKPGGQILPKLRGHEIDLTWETIARLGELAYRCTICRRCTQTCPLGVDNGLITHEIRKLFSQEMGISPSELHSKGSVQHLEKGSSTGMTEVAFKDVIEFIQEDYEERMEMEIPIPLDKEGADILLIHNAGEFMSWPENPAAFAMIFNAAGLSWTLSSEQLGYDGVNYGLWYDDVQLARVALKHAQIAKKLGVKKIVVGECGHSHKAIAVIADRVLNEDMNVPRESSITLLEDLVTSGRLKLDPSRNDFPVTLHDPCNLVRLMGVVEPQRRILRKIAPQFREMNPHGTENYCCGGGSGFAIMPSMNWPSWKMSISGRMKMKQMLDAFSDVSDPEQRRYVCAPCSNCKGQIRDMLEHFEIWDRTRMWYGGLVELIVNAMVDVEVPFLLWPDDDDFM